MRSLWMLVAGFMFACMGVFVKLGAQYFSSTELVFYRSLLGVWITFGVIRYQRLPIITPHWKIHCWRGVSGLISLLLFFYCLTRLPLATAISLNYTWSLFVALFSTLILKEQIHWTLIGSILIGFVGVILLLQPDLTEQAFPMVNVMGVASGFFAGIAYINVKQLGLLGESEWRVVFYFTLISTLVTGIWLLFTHMNPVTEQGLMVLLGMGVTATLAQLAMTRAYHTGVTLVVTALGYSTVLFSSLLGVWYWNEALSSIAWSGIVLIVLGGSASGILSLKQALVVSQK